MKRLLLALTFFAVASVVDAANLPYFTGPTGTNPATLPAAIPDLNALTSEVNTLVTPQTMGAYTNFRNLLDNGSIQIQQRGTAAIAGASTAPAIANYSADRWLTYTNVSSGAGYAQVVTSTPAPLTAFQQSLNVYRNSGSLAQPVCVTQEVPTADSVALQGQSATFSAYLQALAGLAADNGSVVNMYIFTGTGTDQGFISAGLTASPAVTPAWTNISSSITAAQTLTTSWQRYSVTGVIPVATKEIAVAVCFTPTITSSGGSTDGFSMVGAQLEQGTSPSSYEFKPYQVELQKAQRYYWQITDVAATISLPSNCNVTTANTTVKCSYFLPQVMRAIPTATVGTATSFGIWLTAGTAGTCSTLAAASTASTTQASGLTCTTAGTIALGTGTMLIGAGTAGTLSASSDF
jgi:hypothetical protein